MTTLPENLTVLKEFAADLEKQSKREQDIADRIGRDRDTLRQSQLVHEQKANALCAMRAHLAKFIAVCESPDQVREDPL